MIPIKLRLKQYPKTTGFQWAGLISAVAFSAQVKQA
jgi:hypothetical protein